MTILYRILLFFYVFFLFAVIINRVYPLTDLGGSSWSDIEEPCLTLKDPTLRVSGANLTLKDLAWP